MAISALDFTTYRQPRPLPRSLGDKLQIIAGRSPDDLKALEILVDLVYKRVTADDPPTAH